MNATTHVKTAGFLGFWTVASFSDPLRLKEGFESIGMEAPLPLQPSVALRESLVDHFRGNNVLVRPLDDEGGFLVLDETRGKDMNEYKKLFTVRVENEGKRLSFSPTPSDVDDIAKLYVKRRNSVPGHAIGSALVRVVKKLRGTTIRRTGGIYWLHQRHAPIWSTLQKVVQGSATFGQSEVYMATMKVDAESIRVVKDAIQREILGESQKLLDELTTGELGERAVESRLTMLKELKAKVEEYEGVVGDSLKHLTEALDNVMTASGVGAMHNLVREQLEPQVA